MSGNDLDVARDRHRWFRDRLDAAASHLLSDADRRLFDEHADSCPECRAALKLHRDNLPEPDADYRHIPAFMMARWDRRAGGLRGMERRLARLHLESCESCRSALEVLGYEPRMVEDPILEGTRLAGASVRRSDDDEISWGQRIRDWLIGGAGGALVTAAAALLLLPNIVQREPSIVTAPPLGPSPTVPTSPTPATPSATGYSIDILSPAPSVPAFEDPPRGPGGHAPSEIRLQVAAGTRFVQFPIPFALSGTRAEIDVFGPSGARLAHEVYPFARLGGKSRILFGQSGQVLDSGSYRLRVVLHPTPETVAQPDTFETDFHLDMKEAPKVEKRPN